MLDKAQQIARDGVKAALEAGATAADAVYSDNHALSVSWRQGKLESLESSQSSDLALRVLYGKRQVVVSSTDHKKESLEDMARRAVAMARLAPEDPYCGLADPSQLARDFPSLEMADAYDLNPEVLMSRARQAEESAMSVEGVSLCDSTGAGGGVSHVEFANSAGFEGAYRQTHYGVSAAVLAGQGTLMQQDYDYQTKVFQEDLEGASMTGLRAGQRAVAALNARRMKTSKTSVVFAPRVARSLVGIFAGAINGSTVARGVSFLKDKLGQPVFPKEITLIDDPLLRRGLRSRLFDGEGLAVQKRVIADQGVLQTWLLDLSAARQLGMESTGHAARGGSGVPYPSPTNLYVQAGDASPDALIKDIRSGFYVTELMGDGVNGVTGDFSQAARGFWIEGGQIAFPVHEMTVAGNLKDMFACLRAADDLVFRYGLNAPTLRVDGMVVAGT
ncbi:MAG: TldD/PmbA family protein [Alphaproteobacteria bacterium]|nr:TldD/PmbA family protein [Alphaproteobacteria bacterium]